MIAALVFFVIAQTSTSTSTAAEASACVRAPGVCRQAFERVRQERTRCAIASKSVIDGLRIQLDGCTEKLDRRSPDVVASLVPPCPNCGPTRSAGALWGSGALGAGVGGVIATTAFCDDWDCRKVGLSVAATTAAVGGILLWLFDE